MNPLLIGGAVVIGGVAIYEGVKWWQQRQADQSPAPLPCPTDAQLTQMIADIDSGKTALGVAQEFVTAYAHCPVQAAALSKAVIAKTAFRPPSTGPVTWPATDPKCTAAFALLPTTIQKDNSPSFASMVLTAIAAMERDKSPKPLYDAANALDDAASSAGTITDADRNSAALTDAQIEAMCSPLMSAGGLAAVDLCRTYTRGQRSAAQAKIASIIATAAPQLLAAADCLRNHANGMT